MAVSIGGREVALVERASREAMVRDCKMDGLVDPADEHCRTGERAVKEAGKCVTVPARQHDRQMLPWTLPETPRSCVLPCNCFPGAGS